MKTMFAALAALLLAPPALADTLVDNVNGYTLGGDGGMIRFAGLVIGDDGKVKQLLKQGEKPAASPSSRVDGKGRTMLPGMIDSHGHIMALGFQAIRVDLAETNSLEQAQAKIAAYAAANPGLPWIIGWGWDHEKWRLGRYPTAADIDKIVPDRPVWLERIDGHAGLANSAAMKLAGVDAATPAPKDGAIERNGNAPSGVFIDSARDLITRAIPAPLPSERDAAFAAAQQILLGYGVTAFADMGTTTGEWAVMRRAADNGCLDMRIVSYAGTIDILQEIAGSNPTSWLYDNKLRMAGIKIFVDGALGSRGAWMKQDYSDKPGWRGSLFHTDAELMNLMSSAAKDGFQVAVHAIGDAGNVQLLDAIDALSVTYSGDRRWRIEHAQNVDPADFPRFGKHGIVVSMQPVHENTDWRMAEARVGPARLGGAYAWNGIAGSGARLVFGSDTPVVVPNPYLGLAVAISRLDDAGEPAGGWLPEQSVSLEKAFAAYTVDAAWGIFADDKLGSLEPGKMADFALIDRDIFAGASQEDIRATKVLETWVGGRKVWERK